MKALKKNELLVVAVLLMSLVGILRALTVYSAANFWFYCIITGFALESEFGPRRHLLSAILWSLLTTHVLGWLLGLISVGIYWLLFFQRKDLGTNTGEVTRRSENGNGTGDLSYLDGKKIFARLPLVRIPIPWMWYIVTERQIIRVSLFRGEDPFPFSKMYDVRITDPKVHKDEEIRWKWIRNDQAQRIYEIAQNAISISK